MDLTSASENHIEIFKLKTKQKKNLLVLAYFLYQNIVLSFVVSKILIYLK